LGVELNLSNFFRYLMFRGVLNDLLTLGFVLERNQDKTQNPRFFEVL
jgi:hypothetical protein